MNDRTQKQFTTRALIVATLACSVLTAMWTVVLRQMTLTNIIDQAILGGWILTTNGQVLFSTLVLSRIRHVPVNRRRDYYTATALSLFPLSFVLFMWVTASTNSGDLTSIYLSFSCFLLVMLVFAILGLFSPSRVPLRDDIPFAGMRLFVLANYLMPLADIGRWLSQF